MNFKLKFRGKKKRKRAKKSKKELVEDIKQIKVPKPEKVKKKEIVIPGYVAQLQGELEEELGDGWKVVVGPREAGEVPKFLKEYAG